MTEKIIMYESDEAATYTENMCGWFSSQGIFYGDKEDLARYAGCTHKTCECGNIHSKTWLRCDDCRGKAADEQYRSLEYREWKGEPVVMRDHESYFFSDDELFERMFDDGVTSVDLYICEPNTAPYIDDYASDVMPEDMTIDDVEPELAELIAAVNSYVAANKPVMSWRAGRYRTTVALPQGYGE